MAAFRRAFGDGADGIEFDVRLARDGVPVIIHDSDLRRTAQRSGAVADFTSSALTQIPVGAWFNRQCNSVAATDFDNETIPTLKQLFESVAHVQGLLYLEMKRDERQSHTLAAAIVGLIREFNFATRVVVESFHLPSLSIVKALDPGIRLAPLFERRLRPSFVPFNGTRMLDLARQLGADEIALHRSLIRPAVINAARRYSLPTVAWTVDNPRWIKRARALGLHALITNDPQKMLQARAELREP